MKEKMKKFGAWLLAAALAFAGAGAAQAETVTVTSQEELVAAVNAIPANGEGEIILNGGEFTLYHQGANTTGKSIAFIGQVDANGKPATTWNYGGTAKAKGEGSSDYSFDGAGTISFKNVIFKDAIVDDGSLNYCRGFVRAANMAFENCKFGNMIGYWGTGSVSFKDCFFDVDSTYEYSLKLYSGHSFVFDSCTFMGNKKGYIQLFRESDTTRHAVTVRNCKFEAVAQTSKTAVYFYDYDKVQGSCWDIAFEGENVNVGNKIGAHTTSGTWLWGDMQYASAGTAVVRDNGIVVWQDGKKVAPVVEDIKPVMPTASASVEVSAADDETEVVAEDKAAVEAVVAAGKDVVAATETGIGAATEGVEATAKYVSVILTAAKVAKTDSATVVKSMTFEVKPCAVTSDGVSVIPNEKITAPITVRFPVDAAVAVGTKADVTHNGVAMTGDFAVASDDTAKYIEVASATFSTFAYTLIEGGEEPTAVAKVIDAEGNETPYETLQAAVAAVEDGQTIKLLAGTIEEGEITLPDTIKNVTIKGAADHASILKNTTLAHRTNGKSWEGLTIEGIDFESSSGILIVGWGAGNCFKNVTIKDNIFRNFVSADNNAPIHFNVGEKLDNIVISGNLIDGVSGSSTSGICFTVLDGSATISGNTIKNVTWDAIQAVPKAGAEVTITGNTFDFVKTNQKRGIHLQSDMGVDYSATIKNNVFLGALTESSGGALEVYYFADPDKMDVSGNYYSDTQAIALSCVSSGTAAGNATSKIYPIKANAAFDDTTLIYKAAAIDDGVWSTVFYDTLDAAIKAAGDDKLDTIKIVDPSATAPEGYEIKNGKIVKKAKAVAEIFVGDESKGKYETLQAAFEAAGQAKNVTIELLSDVDLKDVDWPSIHFNGTFDGKGYTISNLKIAYNQEHSGFIRYSDNGAVVKDVTFKDSTVTGNRASVVIGYGYGCTAEDVTVDGAVITGVQKCGGIVAYVGEGAPLTITGCTVKNLKFVYADLEKDGNGGTSFGGLAGFVQYGVNAVITDNKVSGISFVGALDEATFEKYYGSIQDNDKYYQLTCHPFIAAVMGTVDQGVTTPVSVTLADNEVEQVSGLLIGPTTTEYMGFYYREGWTTRRVVDITVDGVLMPNRAVAQIGEEKFYSIHDAFVAVNSLEGMDEVTIKILQDAKSPLEDDYTFNKDVVIDSDVEGGVTLDFVSIEPLWSIDSAAGKRLTVTQNVKIRNLGQFFGSYDAYLYDDAEIYQIWPYKGVVNIMPGAKVRMLTEMIKIRYNGTLNVTGTDAGYDSENKQLWDGYVWADYTGTKAMNLKDTYVALAHVGVDDDHGAGAFDLALDNATLELGDSTGVSYGSAGGTISLKNSSLIIAAAIKNVTTITIDGASYGTEPVKVIDYTGKTAMTLDDYGTVTVTGGEAYVEDNDLWIKPLVAPPEVDVKDESGDPEVKDAEGKEIPEEKKEDAKKVADEVKTEVTQTLTEPEVAKFEGTGVAEAATETKQAGEEHQIIEVKPAVVEALREEAETEDEKKEITKDSKVESRVEIVFDELEVKVDTSAEEVKATETSVQYEVTPKVKTTVTVEGQEPKVVEAVIPNSVIAGNPIKFRLAVDSTFGDFAKVLHTGAEDNFLEEYLAEVVTANDASGKKFVELSSDHFSTFKLTSTDATPVCRVGDKNYTSLAEAIEKGGATAEIVLVANIELTEDVTLGYNQTIDPSEFAISGAGTVKAAEGYEVRIVNGKSVVYAKPTEVTVAGDQKIAVCIEPTVLAELGGAAALADTAANGFQVWQNYVMGVDGAVAGNKLVPICKPNAENPGAAAVTIKTPMTFGTAPAKTGIAVTYQLLKSATPKSGFTMVGEEQPTPVFAVDTSAEENATYWKIQAIFTPDAN